MLQSRSRAARQLLTPHICSTCVSGAVLRAPPAILSRQRPALAKTKHIGRALFSTTPHRADNQSSPEDHHKELADLKAQAEKAAALASKKERKKIRRAAKEATALLEPDSSASKKDPKGEDATEESDAVPKQDSEADRQYQVLQGALSALKNVLSAQNISVSNMANPAQGTKSKNLKQSQEVQKPSTKGRQKRKQKKTPPSPKSTEVEAQQETKEDALEDGRGPFSLRPSRGKVKAFNPVSLRRQKIAELRQSLETEIKTPLTSLGRPVYAKAKDETAENVFKKGKKSKNDKDFKEEQSDLIWNGKAQGRVISTINAGSLPSFEPIHEGALDVPTLSYGLDRVLFNPGVYFLQDPRSRVYNFDPYLAKIMPIQEFDFNALKEYVTSSKDTTLISIAKKNQKKYTGSTSSMTSMLSHFHYLLSAFRPINTNMLSRSIVPESTRFTAIMRAPAATFLHWKDGTYAIDADKEFDSANILSMLGKSMEKLLTLPKEDFEKYRHSNSGQLTEEERNAEEAYHYTGFGDFMMRSQLDAYDKRVPESGMFDLKTRAVVSIRMDAAGFQKGLGYEIRERHGQWQSFEREYLDMIRSAFLKYSLQVRMGRMDGIFVAFHNTQRIFGFQYISLSEMDLALHGTDDLRLGNTEYKTSLKLMNEVMDRASERFPGQSLRMHYEARESKVAPFMYIFAKPVTSADIDEVQSSKRAAIDAFERDVLGLMKEQDKPQQASDSEETQEMEDDDYDASTKAPEEQGGAAWDEVMDMVENTMNDDEQGTSMVREAIADALEQSLLVNMRDSADASEYVDALLGTLIGEENRPATETSVLTEDQEDNSPESEPEEELVSSTAVNETAVDSKPDERSSELQHEASHEDEQQSSSQLVEQSQDNGSVDETPSQGRKTDQSEGGNAATSPRTDDDALMTGNTPSEATETIVDDVEETEYVAREAAEAFDMEGTADPAIVPSLSPLRDLIIRMARRIDEGSFAQEESDLSAEDAAKLKAFERILGDMISSARSSGVTDKTDGTSMSEDAGDYPELKPIPNINEVLDQRTPSQKPSKSEQADADPGPLLGMVLTIKNKINGKYVARPNALSRRDKWVIEYNIQEIPEARARTLYAQCQKRRKTALEDTENRDSEWYKMWGGELSRRTEEGRRWRKKEVLREKTRPIHVVDQDQPLKWEEVFGDDGEHDGNATGEFAAEAEIDHENEAEESER